MSFAMCGSLAVAVFLAVCCLSFSAAADPIAPSLLSLVAPGDGGGEESVMACTPFIKRSNGSYYRLTLSQYLGNEKVSKGKEYIRCSSSVSTELKDIFNNSIASLKVQSELRSSLGNVCSLYVEVFSRLARMSKSSAMCDAGALQDDVVKDRDFCTELVPESVLVISTLSNLDALGYSNYSSALTSLFGLSSDACTSKCGSGSGRILCNAYFSMATVLSTAAAQILAAPSSRSQPPTGEPLPNPTTPALPQVATPPTDGPVPISRLLEPLQSLPVNRLFYLTAGASQYREQQLTSLLTNFTLEELKEFLERKDVVTILRMFWVANLVYDKLSKIDEGNLEFATRYDNLFHMAGLQPGDPVVAMVKSFDDKDKVLEYIHTYRSDLFAERGQSPSEPPAPSVSTGKVTPDSDGESDGGKHDEPLNTLTPNHDDTLTLDDDPDDFLGGDLMQPGDEELVLADIAADPNFQKIFDSKYQDDNAVMDIKRRLIYILRVDGEDELLEKLNEPEIRAALGLDTDGAAGVVPSDQPVNSHEPVDQDVSYKSVDSDNSNLPGDPEPDYYYRQNYGVVYSTWPERPVQSIHSKRPVQSVYSAKPDWQVNSASNEVGDVNGNAADQPPSRGYGAFHFLGLFIVVAVAAVVGYLCMHNRKKVLERVSAMSGSGQRRNYRPLTTYIDQA